MSSIINRGQQLFIISVDDVEIGYAEVYSACDDRIAQYYPLNKLDYGWHVLVGEPQVTGQGYGYLVVQALTAYCFDQLGAARVLCEPDISVVALEKITVRLGYKKYGQIQLPEKTSYVFICEAAKFKQHDEQAINTIDETNVKNVKNVKKKAFV